MQPLITVAAPSSCPPSMTCASFSYPSTSRLRVLSVTASQEPTQNGLGSGRAIVAFAITFENTGNSTIYVPDGSTGATSSDPGHSPVLQEFAAPLCAGMYVVAKVSPGQNYTLSAPSCATGYEYTLKEPGAVDISFAFNWSTDPSATTNPNDFPNSTTISAEFTFS